MKLNCKNSGNSHKIVNRTEMIIQNVSIENNNYLYPNGHRITHQMRWFKGSQDKGLNSDISL